MANPLAQFVRNRVMNSPPGLAGALRTRIWRRVERGILRVADPAVRYRLHGFELEMPLSHRLPWFQRDVPGYGWNLARIAKVVAQKYPATSAIDVGANVGDSVAIMRTAAKFPILCVEADERYFRFLTENLRQFSDVVAARAYVGDAAAKVAGKIESDHGTARLRLDAGETVNVRPLDEVLDGYPGFARSKLLKIDTDGFDCKILRGSRALMLHARPVIFFEYDPHFLAEQGDDGISIFPLLASNGYSKALVYDNLGKFAGPLDTADQAATRALHDSYLRAKGTYADLCAFHDEDSALLDEVLSVEQSLV